MESYVWSLLTENSLTNTKNNFFASLRFLYSNPRRFFYGNQLRKTRDFSTEWAKWNFPRKPQKDILAGLVFSAFRTAEEEPRLLEMMPILLTFKAVQHPTCLALVHLHDSSLLCVYPMIFVDASLLLQTFPFSRRGKCASPTYRQALSGVLTWTTSTTRVHAGSQRQSTYVYSRPHSNLAG